MSIGEALTQARQQAGLTVAQVSARTRIRETIIRDIEAGDYASCGGDFWARGHIRSIARVTGADPVALIHAYDEAQLAPPDPVMDTVVDRIFATGGSSGSGWSDEQVGPEGWSGEPGTADGWAAEPDRLGGWAEEQEGPGRRCGRPAGRRCRLAVSRWPWRCGRYPAAGHPRAAARVGRRPRRGL